MKTVLWVFISALLFTPTLTWKDGEATTRGRLMLSRKLHMIAETPGADYWQPDSNMEAPFPGVLAPAIGPYAYHPSHYEYYTYTTEPPTLAPMAE